MKHQYFLRQSGITTVAALFVLVIVGFVMTISATVIVYQTSEAFESLTIAVEEAQNEWLPEINYAGLDDVGGGYDGPR